MSNHTEEKSLDSQPTPSAPTKKTKERFHVVRGIPHRVLRSTFDPKHNCVMDVVEFKKIVKNRKGDDVEVTLERHMRCEDLDIQERFVKQAFAQIPIEVNNG